jgi:hypothetical protein
MTNMKELKDLEGKNKDDNVNKTDYKKKVAINFIHKMLIKQKEIEIQQQNENDGSIGRVVLTPKTRKNSLKQAKFIYAN